MAEKHTGGGGSHGFDISGSGHSGGGGSHGFDIPSSGGSCSGFFLGVSSAWQFVKRWWSDFLDARKALYKENYDMIVEMKRRERKELMKSMADNFTLLSRLGFVSFFCLLALAGWKVLRIYVLKRR